MPSSRAPIVVLALVVSVTAGAPRVEAGGARSTAINRIKAVARPGSSRIGQRSTRWIQRTRASLAAKKPLVRRPARTAISLGRQLVRGPDRRTGARDASEAARRQRATIKTLIDAGVEPERLSEVAEHVSLGMPSRASAKNPDDYVLAQPGYVSSYNRRRKAPNWVAVKITRSDVTGRYSKRLRFKRNQKIPDDWEPASQKDYKGEFKRQQITRGHLVGSGDQTADPDSHRDTYLLQTNVVPQIYENNAGPWHDFEVYLRNQARERKDVYVFAGGVYGRRPVTIGRHRIPIPKATWKVAVVVEPGQTIDSPSTKVMYLVVPNEVGKVRLNQTFESYLVEGPVVERMTGLRFFTNQMEPVRRQLLEQRYRPEVPIHYWSRRKLGEIRKMGLEIPANVRMDPADLRWRERVALALRRTAGRIAGFLRRGRDAGQRPTSDRSFQPTR